MSIQTATESVVDSEMIANEFDPRYNRGKVTIVSGAGALKVGSVLGKLTSGGKYQLSPNSGSDGSETAVAVLLQDVDATSADVTAEVLLTGPALIVDHLLRYDSTVDNDTKKTTKRTQLAAVGIKTVKGA